MLNLPPSGDLQDSSLHTSVPFALPNRSLHTSRALSPPPASPSSGDSSVDLGSCLHHDRNLYINKRKFQHGNLDLPIPKHPCLEKSSSLETCFPSNYLSDIEDLRNNRKESSINNNNYSKYNQLGEGSGKDSNSFTEDADSVMSVSNDSKNERLDLNICQCNHHSTSSVNFAGRFFDTSVNYFDRLETKTCDEVSMNPDYSLYVSSCFEEQQLDCGYDGGFSSSDYETGKIKQLEDEALEDLFCSNGVVSNNFVLSSGRWNVNQDTEQDTENLTIDKEFEQYFSMLML